MLAHPGMNRVYFGTRDACAMNTKNKEELPTDWLLTGPDLFQKTVGITFRLSEHRLVFTADIEAEFVLV